MKYLCTTLGGECRQVRWSNLSVEELQMPGLLKKLARAGAILGVVAVFSIGAREAMAGDVARASSCQFCNTQDECYFCCLREGNPGGQCQTASGACLCF